MRFLLLATMSPLLLLTACNDSVGHKVEDHNVHGDANHEMEGSESEAAYIRMPLEGRDVTAGYFRLQGLEPGTRLVSATTSIAGRVELHTHLHEDGIMKMRKVEFFEADASGRIALEPMGPHLMFFDLKEGLKAGEQAMLELKMSDGSTHEVHAVLKAF